MRHRTDRRLGRPSFADQQPAAAEVDRDDAAQCGLILDDQHTPVGYTWRFGCGAAVRMDTSCGLVLANHRQ